MAASARAMAAANSGTKSVPWFQREDARRAVREFLREWNAVEIICTNVECEEHEATCRACGHDVEVGLLGGGLDDVAVDALVEAILRARGVNA